MYVKTERDNLQQIRLPEMSKAANFSENNIAQLPEDDAQYLIENVGHVTAKDS